MGETVINMTKRRVRKIIVENGGIMNIHDPVEESLEQEWFETHEKDKYSMTDFIEYSFSRFPGLKESIEELEKGNPENDVQATIEQKIRRTIKKNFSIKKKFGRDSYELDKFDTIYLVNDLLRDYFNKFIFIHKEPFTVEEKLELLKSFVSAAENLGHGNNKDLVKIKEFLNNL